MLSSSILLNRAFRVMIGSIDQLIFDFSEIDESFNSNLFIPVARIAILILVSTRTAFYAHEILPHNIEEAVDDDWEDDLICRLLLIEPDDDSE